MDAYEKIIEVAWADVDPNGHVRHSKYYEYGAHVRIRFFSDAGLAMTGQTALQVGPVAFKEECSFIRELRLEDTIRVNLLKGDISPDGSRWVLHHEIFNTSGIKCAHLTLRGAWMDLEARKLTLPPQGLAAALHALKPGEAYVYRKKG